MSHNNKIGHTFYENRAHTYMKNFSYTIFHKNIKTLIAPKDNFLGSCNISQSI